MDTRFRELERLALQGGIEEKAALISAALRAGWPLLQVEAAADLHHEPSWFALGRRGQYRGLQASLQAIVMDKTLDQEIFRQIAVDLLDHIRKNQGFRYYAIPKAKEIFKHIRNPTLTNRQRDKLARLVMELENDLDYRYRLFGASLGEFLPRGFDRSQRGRTDTGNLLANVMWHLSNPVFQWASFLTRAGWQDYHNAFRPFFLNRLVPSAAV